MTLHSSFLVYPDGDSQETETQLRIDQIVDVNGYPIVGPLPTHKMIVYRVQKIVKSEDRVEAITRYYLELVTGEELLSLSR